MVFNGIYLSNISLERGCNFEYNDMPFMIIQSYTIAQSPSKCKGGSIKKITEYYHASQAHLHNMWGTPYVKFVDNYYPYQLGRRKKHFLLNSNVGQGCRTSARKLSQCHILVATFSYVAKRCRTCQKREQMWKNVAKT